MKHFLLQRVLLELEPEDWATLRLVRIDAEQRNGTVSPNELLFGQDGALGPVPSGSWKVGMSSNEKDTSHLTRAILIC